MVPYILIVVHNHTSSPMKSAYYVVLLGALESKYYMLQVKEGNQ